MFSFETTARTIENGRCIRTKANTYIMLFTDNTECTSLWKNGTYTATHTKTISKIGIRALQRSLAFEVVHSRAESKFTVNIRSLI